jgi:hypothetical protein
MGQNKRGGGADDLYRTHLYGTPYHSNPTNNRKVIIERMYMRLLTELCANRFEWKNVPDSIDVRFMELTLFNRALAVFYWDTDYDKHLVLEAGSTGFFDLVKNPTAFTTIGNDYISKTLGAYQPHKTYAGDEAKLKAIPIWSNYIRVPDWDIVQIYASRLAEMDMTIEINSKNARQNLAVITNESTKLSGVNIVRQMQEGSNVLQLNADGPLADMSFIQAVTMNQDVDSIEKLHIVRTRMWNECMGLLGINNANQDKKERLVSDEVDANNDQTSMMRYVNLNARRKAVEQINSVHGLKISVDYYTDEPVQAPVTAVVSEDGDE